MECDIYDLGAYGNKRGRGRPATRWGDEILRRVVPQWMEIAQNNVVTQVYA